MCPNKENIIDRSKAYQKLKLLREEISFYLMHKSTMEANFVPVAVLDVWCYIYNQLNIYIKLFKEIKIYMFYAIAFDVVFFSCIIYIKLVLYIHALPVITLYKITRCKDKITV